MSIVFGFLEFLFFGFFVCLMGIMVCVFYFISFLYWLN